MDVMFEGTEPVYRKDTRRIHQTCFSMQRYFLGFALFIRKITEPFQKRLHAPQYAEKATLGEADVVI